MMKITENTRRMLIFRALERVGLPSYALRELTDTKYRVDLFPKPYTLIFDKSVNPFKLERAIRKEISKP